MTTFNFNKVLLPSGAYAFNAIAVDSFNEMYPLDSISVHYYDLSGSFQIRILDKRIIAFTRSQVTVPTSTSDADLLAQLENMVMAINTPGGGSACVQVGTADGQVLVWDNTALCWVVDTTPPANCIESGVLQGDTLYWDSVDQCWKSTDTIKHGEIGVALTTNATDKPVVLISENNTNIGINAYNATVSNSTNCTINSDSASIENSFESAINSQVRGSTIKGSLYSVIDCTGTSPDSILNGIYHSSLTNITDVYNANIILGSGGAKITGAQLGNPTTGGGRSIISSGGVELADVANARRVFIDSEGLGQNMTACFVDFNILNASLSIQSDMGINTIHTSFVDTDNNNCGIFDGKAIAMLGCRNPIYSGNGTCEVMLAMDTPNITTGQNYTLHFQNERSTGGKQYRIDNYNFGTTLGTENNIISVDTSAGAFSFFLPVAPVNGQTYNVFDNSGNASTNNITLDAVAKVINSPTTQASTYVIDQDYSGVSLTYDSVTDKWHLVSASFAPPVTPTCLEHGVDYGQTLYWDAPDNCWTQTYDIQRTDNGSNTTNPNTDKNSYFISSNNCTIQSGSLTSSIIASENATLSNTGGNAKKNAIISSRYTNNGAAFGVDGSHNVSLATEWGNTSGSNFTASEANEYANLHLCNRVQLGYGSQLNAQGCNDALLSGINNTLTNVRNAVNIGGRYQLIGHNPTAGKDNAILNSPYTQLYGASVIDFTNILQYMDDERTATNYTDNISVGGGGNIVKSGAGGAFGNGFFNSFANYVNVPVSTFTPGQIFGVNSFINSQECYIDNLFGDAAFCTFINCWQSGIIQGTVSNPFTANNTIIGGGVGVGSSGCTWVNGGTLTDSGGGLSMHGNGTQNSAVQSIQIGARGASNIDSSQRGVQIGVDATYINNGSIACGQFTTANCLTDNSERCGSMFVAVSAIGSNVGAVRVIDSLASSHCNIYTTTVASYVDITDCQASGIRDCKFVGTLGEPNYNPVGGSWGFINATTKHSQSMLACYNTDAEVGNNCVVMTMPGLSISDTQDNKLHVATTRHYGGEQRKFYNTASNETVKLDETYHILFGVDTPTYVLPASPIPGQEYFFRELEDDGFVVDGNGNNIGDYDSNVAILTVLPAGGKYLHLVYNGRLWVQMLLV